jgi:hypothetical protein
VANPYYEHGKEYAFKDLHPEHRAEVLGQMDKEEAGRSVWLFRVDFPTSEARWIAEQATDVDLGRIEAVVQAIEAGGQMRPILIAERPEASEEESSYWIEGAHRAYAASDLGWEHMPVLYRIA